MNFFGYKYQCSCDQTLRFKHIPRHALRLRTRRTDGGIVDDPSVSASYRLQTNASQRRTKHDLKEETSKETQKRRYIQIKDG